MDWSEDGNGHGHMRDGCQHGHSGHSHSHGPRAAAFGGLSHLYAPAYGPPGKGSEQMMDISQQPKKRSLMDDSSSWDIVKATQFGILERCKELVEAGYDVRQPDKENVTLLHWAAINNRSELVKYFISKGAVVDQLGGDLKSTPLHWAIRQGHLPMVIQLLRYGADPSVTDGEGYRSLHLAILFQHMAIAAYLMAKGQEVDEPDCNGQTPLMLAAQKIIGPEPTNFLIKNNASVSAVDKVSRNTPLHCAVLAGNVDAAHILLEAGASVDAENINGHTPIDLAHQVHSPLLIHMLNQVKQERIRSSSRCLRAVNRYRVFLQFLSCTALFGCVGAIVDMDSESWLLKGILLACVMGVINLVSRNFPSPDFHSLLPASTLMASVFWMLVTWYLWFLPDGPSSTVQVLFTLNATALLYYYVRTCRTDPGFIKTTEEKKKMNVLVLAEAGCLDPRIFCTTCMVRKPVRAMHCFSCDACVAKQDHHSVWTNTCIGARNHHYFVLFVFSFVLMGAWMFYGCLRHWQAHCQLNYQEQGLWGAVPALVSCSPWVLGIFLLAFYFTCLFGLTLLQQLYQVAFLGITTAERMTMMFQQKKLRQSVPLRQNPFNMGVVQNLVSFFQLRCCGLFKPSTVDWTLQFAPQRDQFLFDQVNMV
ncbi:putative palmitoyltransferase ZDHHC13 [Menidia menidia]